MNNFSLRLPSSNSGICDLTPTSNSTSRIDKSLSALLLGPVVVTLGAIYQAIHTEVTRTCLPEVSSGAMDGEGWGPPGDPVTLEHQDVLPERREGQG